MLRILQGHVLDKLAELPDNSIHCVVTSPPYWGLRDYKCEPQVWAHVHDVKHARPDNCRHKWSAATETCFECGAWRGQLGLEPTPALFIEHVTHIFRQVRRVLHPSGTLWLNMGDSYAGSPAGNFGPDMPKPADGGAYRENKPAMDFGKAGYKAKDLMGMPFLVSEALRQDGWYRRSIIIWHKPNPMPESVTDRPTTSHEYIFLMSKSGRYFYDAEAVKEPVAQASLDDGRTERGQRGQKGQYSATDGACGFNPSGRNKRSVWTVPTSPYPEAHFATYPPDLVKPCILAGTSAKGCCPQCLAPWERIVEAGESMWEERKRNGAPMRAGDVEGGRSLGSVENKFSGKILADWKAEHPDKTTGWQPTCKCDAPMQRAPIPCTVLDPFAGSGTTGAVALELGRHAVLIELNPKYVELIKKRCNAVTPGMALA